MPLFDVLIQRATFSGSFFRATSHGLDVRDGYKPFRPVALVIHAVSAMVGVAMVDINVPNLARNKSITSFTG